MPIVERVADSCELGEGPHWDVDTQSLYYVDIFGHSIHKYTPSTKTHTKAIVGEYTHIINYIHFKKSILKVMIQFRS